MWQLLADVGDEGDERLADVVLLLGIASQSGTLLNTGENSILTKRLRLVLITKLEE